MTQKFSIKEGVSVPVFSIYTEDGKELSSLQLLEILNAYHEENEQLRNKLTFLNKVISFFADNPMTKYSSKSELLEEMKLLEKMGLI